MREGLELRPYQVEDVAFLMREPRFGLLSDPRTGKTPPACVYIWWLWSDLGEKIIWSMPKSLLKKNFYELIDWTDFTPNDLCIWNGRNDKPDHKVFLTTFKTFSAHWRSLLDRHTKTNAHVIDEPHLDGGFKTDSSVNCQALYASGRIIERFVPMTGSLINGRLSSAYPIIHMIEPRYYSSLQNFEWEHAIKDEFTGKIVGWRNHARLRTIIEAHSSRRSFFDCYGEKSIVLDLEEVDMAPMQRAKYDEFHESGLLELEDRWLDGSLPGVATIRCHQIMGHPEHVELPVEYNDDGKPISWKTYNLVGDEETGKDAALRLHFANHYNTGKPLIVFAALQEEQRRIARLAQKIGLRVGVINGSVSLSQRNQIDEGFRAGRLDTIIASEATAGVGFNWGHVDHLIFVSVDYQDANFLQALMRGMTPDKSGLWITILAYKSSLDQRKFKIIETKSRDANAVDPTRPVISIVEGKIVLARRENHV
jgi:hypothetical protein